MVVLTFPLFISSTGTTICGWPWPHCVVPQARTHVIIIQSNIRRVEKDCQDHKYTSFTLGLHIRAAEGSTHKSLILAQRLVGEIKQRQTASPCRDGSADKDLSMAHFHGTEGWKGGREGWKEGGRKQSLSDYRKGCRTRYSTFQELQKNSCGINKQASPTETRSSKACCL